MNQGEVNWLFEGEVRRTQSVNSCCSIIVSASHGFWEKYTDPGNFLSRKSEEAKTSSRILDKHNQPKGSILLGDGIAKILIPDIGLLSLQNVSYLDVVWKIHRENNGDQKPESKVGRISKGIVINVFNFEAESMKVAKLAEVISKDVKNYWRTVSNRRLASRQQRVRLVAADFFDNYPVCASKQDHFIPNTISERRSQKDEPDTTMIDVEQVLANEEQPYTGMSKKTQDFPSQLFTFASPPRFANERRAFNSGPPPGLNHRFRRTFGPVTSIDADGTMVNVPHHFQR